MKTKLFSWMTILLMAFMCVSVTGCSKGGDDTDDQERPDPFAAVLKPRSQNQWYLRLWQLQPAEISMHLSR